MDDAMTLQSQPSFADSNSKALSTLLFKFLDKANWKMPSLRKMRNKRKAENMFGEKKLVVITGTSSGLGRKSAQALLRTGKYHVVGAVRDLDKMKEVSESDEFPADRFTPMHVDLNSFASVRKFCEQLKEFKKGKPIDRLICNAGVFQPSLESAKWSEDDIESTMQINYLSHFLMVSLLLMDLAMATDPRCILLGSDTNTVGGGGVAPIADLRKLDGLKAGAKNPISMFDGYGFNGAKAYKDSEICNMMLANILHDRYHKQTGIAFSSVYPGCIPESPLYREKPAWFLESFPLLEKYIAGGFVSEEDAGQRLFQVAHDVRCSKSGVYWSWNGGEKGEGEESDWASIYENEQSDKVVNKELCSELFKLSSKVTGAEWPKAYQPKSPCPTLKVVGAVTSYMNAKEEAKRMKAEPGTVGGLGFKAVGATAKVADAVLGNTVGLVAKTAQDALLGGLPTTAKEGSYSPTDAGASGNKRRLLSRLRFWEKAQKTSNEHDLDDIIEVGEIAPAEKDLGESAEVPDVTSISASHNVDVQQAVDALKDDLNGTSSSESVKADSKQALVES